MITWENGYCFADGMFAQVINKKPNGDHAVWKLRWVNGNDFYMVEQAGTTAHGKSVREAMLDLRFKLEDRDSSDYEQLTTDSLISFVDAVICYRVLTGACRLGVQEFLENRLAKTKNEYLVSEVIELTKGEYGSQQFEQFFNR